ncbi:DUF5908 family protein [Aquimarina sp. 2201CG1-2-11]|uniref:DUF5908 family protein n=1 Tax=Aquimarina discodermiae TaxID=3231043 RepID=UPI003461DFDF
MPIEIKELHIKINVDEKESTTNQDASLDKKQANTLVRNQVEQIMHIESRKKER